MPRLNGKSSHGSKPITSLSRTFNCTPHCWPQKQQCVFTSRSGSALVDLRRPVGTDRCGPNCSMILSSSTGMVATSAPGGCLREAEQRAPASRTDFLIVAGAARRIHVVREAKLAFDDDEVAHHHRRGEGLAAAAASRLL